MGANAILGSTFANYLYTSALLLLSPLVTSVGLSLSIPISAVTDEVFLGQHAFTMVWALGAALACCGVAFAALDLDGSNADCNVALAEEELQSLLGHQDEISMMHK